MAQYIDKAAAVAEIDGLQETTMDKNRNFLSSYHEGIFDGLSMIESFLDTLEVKDVDLEKEINKYISDNFFGSETMGFFAVRTNEEPNDQDMALCAKHFFELGVKVQKGE